MASLSAGVIPFRRPEPMSASPKPSYEEEPLLEEARECRRFCEDILERAIARSNAPIAAAR
jgi:hypothetical protein